MQDDSFQEALRLLMQGAATLGDEEAAQLRDPLLCQLPTAAWKLMTHQLMDGSVCKGPLLLDSPGVILPSARHENAVVLACCRTRLLQTMGDAIAVVPQLCKTAAGAYYLRSAAVNPSADPARWRWDAAQLKTHGGAQVKVLRRESTGTLLLSKALLQPALAAQLAPHVEPVLWHLVCRYVLAIADSGLWNVLVAVRDDNDQRVVRVAGTPSPRPSPPSGGKGIEAPPSASGRPGGTRCAPGPPP